MKTELPTEDKFRKLLRLRAADPEAFSVLIEIITAQREESFDNLLLTDNEKYADRARGEISILSELLEILQTSFD